MPYKLYELANGKQLLVKDDLILGEIELEMPKQAPQVAPAPQAAIPPVAPPVSTAPSPNHTRSARRVSITRTVRTSEQRVADQREALTVLQPFPDGLLVGEIIALRWHGRANRTQQQSVYGDLVVLQNAMHVHRCWDSKVRQWRYYHAQYGRQEGNTSDKK